MVIDRSIFFGITVAPHAGAWIETRLLIQSVQPSASHPTRVRGLKLYLPNFTLARAWSHPTRVRGLKLLMELPLELLRVSHPTRVRGLKL